MTSAKLPNINELSRRARSIYDSIAKDELEQHFGEFIAIEIDSGKYFYGDTKDTAVAAAKRDYPTKLIFIRPVSQIEKIQTYTKFSNPISHLASAL